MKRSIFLVALMAVLTAPLGAQITITDEETGWAHPVVGEYLKERNLYLSHPQPRGNDGWWTEPYQPTLQDLMRWEGWELLTFLTGLRQGGHVSPCWSLEGDWFSPREIEWNLLHHLSSSSDPEEALEMTAHDAVHMACEMGHPEDFGWRR